MEQPKVAHLFFSHSGNLRKVDLRYIHGSDLVELFFSKWFAEWPVPYRQRYRRQIPFGHVREHGMLLMTLTDEEVTFPNSLISTRSPS